MKKILMILSGATEMKLNDGSTIATGYWAEEVVTPWKVFHMHGFQVDLATPSGSKPEADPLSLDAKLLGSKDKVDFLKAELEQIKEHLDHPLALTDLNEAALFSYAAVFFPGGHGPMVDLKNNAEVSRILNFFDDQSRPIGALCHGPAALLSSAERFQGYRMTCFSNEEENESHIFGKVDETLADALTKKGASVLSAAPWSEHVVVDRNLFTGQNPAASESLTRAIAQAIETPSA